MPAVDRTNMRMKPSTNSGNLLTSTWVRSTFWAPTSRFTYHVASQMTMIGRNRMRGVVKISATFSGSTPPGAKGGRRRRPSPMGEDRVRAPSDDEGDQQDEADAREDREVIVEVPLGRLPRQDDQSEHREDAAEDVRQPGLIRLHVVEPGRLHLRGLGRCLAFGCGLVGGRLHVRFVLLDRLG